MSSASLPVGVRGSSELIPSDGESRNLTRQALVGSRHRPVLIESGSSEHHSAPTEPAPPAKRLRRSARIRAITVPQPALPPTFVTVPATPRLIALADKYPELRRYITAPSAPAAPPTPIADPDSVPICVEFPELQEKINHPMTPFIKLADSLVRGRYISITDHENAMEDIEKELVAARQKDFQQRLKIESLEDELEDLKDRYERRRG